MSAHPSGGLLMQPILCALEREPADRSHAEDTRPEAEACRGEA